MIKFIVDQEDLKRIAIYSWHLSGSGYWSAWVPKERRKIYLHRLIMNAPKNSLVDHINRDPNDNRRCNLRLVNKSLNASNSKDRKNNSGFRGVYYCKKRDRYYSKIRINSSVISLGGFSTALEASEVYRVAQENFLGK